LRPDSGLGFQAKVVDTVQVFLLRSGADLRSSGGRVLVSVDLASQSVTCFRVAGLWLRIYDLWCRGVGLKVKGWGFRV